MVLVMACHFSNIGGGGEGGGACVTSCAAADATPVLS